eukprot:CAMPEP_0197197448 /NCGR_PEP_ID=MMETSP1423-20130617/32872_1 /TAXON_ID=476441 /ORGANISM="Pseudo-nitzschia heimii, Strain UNC1101" /LENGTH=488 /DNA_ID=CAMNT_0042651269 /DNA_START=108 /DNA_END=1572 /DNA_ORIENTATION=-
MGSSGRTNREAPPASRPIRFHRNEETTMKKIRHRSTTTRHSAVDAPKKRRRRRQSSSSDRASLVATTLLVVVALAAVFIGGSNNNNNKGPGWSAEAFPLRGPTSIRWSSSSSLPGGFEARKYRNPRRSFGRYHHDTQGLVAVASSSSVGGEGTGTDDQLASTATNTTSSSSGSGDEVDSPSPSSSPRSYEWTSRTAALALPALIGMLVDPLLSMMDTAYVGNLGSSIELAALGACTSIFHLAFNAFRATTAATTSLVGNASSDREKRSIIKISLSLGLVMGLAVGSVLRLLGPRCLAAMGIAGPSDPLFGPALSYLSTRSLAAPAVLGITVAEADASALSLGVRGAAAATAAAQAAAFSVYLWFLRRRRMMLPQAGDDDDDDAKSPSSSTSPKTSKRRVIRTILGANLTMICKQGSLLLAWAYATAKATRIGAAHVAAHQVALSCWLVFALLQDGAGVAAQVLLTKVLNPNAGDDESDADAVDGAATT